jgi:hypothetical protein
MSSMIADGKNAHTAVTAWMADNPGSVPVADAAVGPAAGAVYTAMRATTGNTVTVAAGGNVTVTETAGGRGLTAGSNYVIAIDGTITNNITVD